MPMRSPSKTVEELSARVETLTLEIKQLLAAEGIRTTIMNYTLDHDRGQSDMVADLFTEDAKLEISGYGERLDTTLQGRASIREMYRALNSKHGGPPPFKHVVTNNRIDIDGNEAIAITYLDWGGAPTDQGPGGGLYHERLKLCSDGRWRFSHKRIVCTSSQTVDAAIAAQI